MQQVKDRLVAKVLEKGLENESKMVGSHLLYSVVKGQWPRARALPNTPVVVSLPTTSSRLRIETLRPFYPF
jgi:hypothetical protein